MAQITYKIPKVPQQYIDTDEDITGKNYNPQDLALRCIIAEQESNLNLENLRGGLELICSAFKDSLDRRTCTRLEELTNCIKKGYFAGIERGAIRNLKMIYADIYGENDVSNSVH